jgi:1,4-alpha-glucan branching enzyme
VILDMVYNHASINDNHSRRYDGNDGAYNRDRNGNFLVLVSHS